MAHVGYREHAFGGPFLPGLGVATAGAGLIAATVLYPAVDVLRILGGVVSALLGVAGVVGGLVATAGRGPGSLPLVPMGLLFLVGALLCFDLPRRLAASGRYRAEEVSRILGGSAAVFAGLALGGLILADSSGMSRGVSPWVGIAAGGVFVLAGVLILVSGRGGLLPPLLLAVFLSLFAALSLALFPPGGLFVAFIAFQGWIAAYRALHQWATGRDPLAGTSQERLLGVGCLVFLVLLLLAGATMWLASSGRAA